jgi:leader peptidase (prepilin peptidase) / N-methyltransferase
MTVVLFVYGLLFGSFSGAAVWRLHKYMLAREHGHKPATKHSMIRGRSMCEGCGHELSAADLVPLLSWLFLGAKCRYCKASLSWKYPVLELVMAVAFTASYVALAPTGLMGWSSLVLWLGVLVALVVLGVYDLGWMLLPDVVLLPLVGLAFARALTLWASGSGTGYLLAGLLAGGSFYTLAAVSGGKWMGGGDIKLAAFMGLWLGPRGTLVAMLVGFNAAAVVGIALLVSRRRRGRDQLPFGPFLVVGTIVAMLWAPQLVGWYLSLGGVG